MAFGDTQEAVVDLTMVFDPATVWPDPQACPDWSMRVEDRMLSSRIDAEDRLFFLHQSLGRGKPTRPPSTAEMAALRAKYFRDYAPEEAGGQGRTVGPWSPLGFPGVTWRDHVQESLARQIVDALHLRGYLRKLESRENRHHDDAEAEKRRRQEHAIEGYAQRAATLQERLNGAKPGEARHLQRIADEADSGRAMDYRRALQALHDEAAAAAAALGVEPPEPPELT